MRAREILFAQFLAAFILANLTWLAIAHSLYWRLWWLDIPMHVLGGVWAGLCGAWLVARRGHSFSIIGCVAFALAVGVAWEIFEYSVGLTDSPFMSYQLDTAKDILMDCVGGFLAALIAKRIASR